MKNSFIKRIAAALCAGALCVGSLAWPMPSRAEETDDAHAFAVQMTASMPLRQKLAQMIMLNIRYWSPNGTEASRVGQTSVNSEMEALLEKYEFAGVLIFAENVTGTAQTTRFMDELHTVSRKSPFGIPVMAAVDQEGGTIVRLGTGTNTCSSMALGATRDPQLAYDNAAIIGEELAAVGIDVDFAPVMDVNNEPRNPIINVRSFSSDPALVSEMGPAFLRGLTDNGIITTAKHFPGHGDTATDSHTGLPLIDRSYAELQARELIPFQAAMDADVDMVMTAHIQYPQIETGTYTSISTGQKIYLPATLSKTILTDIVRGDMGYDGLIVTDGMQMDALKKNFDIYDTAIYAINAGADVLLEPVVTWSTKDISTLEVYLDKLENAVTTGAIPESRINESCTRVIELKYRRGMFEPETEDIETRVAHALEVVGSKAHHDREMAITKKAVTLLKNEDDLLPLTLEAGERVACFYPLDSAANAFTYAFDRLKAEGVIPADAAADLRCYNGATASSYSTVMKNAKAVVIATESTYESHLDPNGTTAAGQRSKVVDAMIALAHSLGKKVVLLSMSLPYDTARFGAADAILAAYSNKKMPVIPTSYNGELTAYGPNYPAAVMTVFGESAPTGKLPVEVYTVDSSYHYTNVVLYPLGYGLTYKGLLGDVNDDGDADAVDASLILVAATRKGVGKESELTADQEERADVNSDGERNAVDASIILVYATAKGVGRDVKLEDFV